MHRGSRAADPDLQVDGRTTLHKEGISLRWERRLNGATAVLHDRFILQNWQHELVEVPIELRFRAAFEDLYQVRGLLQEQLGELHKPAWEKGRLEFRYDGRDGLTRRLTITLSPGLEPSGPMGARGAVRLAPRGAAELTVQLAISEFFVAEDGQSGTMRLPAFVRSSNHRCPRNL